MTKRKPRTLAAVVRRAHERYVLFKTFAAVRRELLQDGTAVDEGGSPLYGFTVKDIPTEKTIRNLLQGRRYDDPSDPWQPMSGDYSVPDTRAILDVLRAVSVASEGKVRGFSQNEAKTIRMIAGLVTQKMSRVWIYILACDFLAKSMDEDTTALELYLAYIGEPNYDDQDVDWLGTYNEAVKLNLIPRLNIVWNSEMPGHIPGWVVRPSNADLPEGDQHNNRKTEPRKSVMKKNEFQPDQTMRFNNFVTGEQESR